MILSKKQIKSQEKLNKIEKMRNYILNIIQRDENGETTWNIDKNKESPDTIQTEQSINKKRRFLNIHKRTCEKEAILSLKRAISDKSTIRQLFKKKIKIPTVVRTVFAIFILFCLLSVSLVFYIPTTENLFSRKISKIIPFPAIIINGKFISYHNYLKEVDSANLLLKQQKEGGIIQEISSRSQIRADVVALLIRQEILKNLAREYNVEVSQQEIYDEIDKLKEKSRSEASFDSVLKDLYGWSEKDFGDKVIRSYLTYSKLLDKIFQDIPEEESKELFNKKIKETEAAMTIFVLVK